MDSRSEDTATLPSLSATVAGGELGLRGGADSGDQVSQAKPGQTGGDDIGVEIIILAELAFMLRLS